jgi:Protein of unknown function (DUF1045)
LLTTPLPERFAVYWVPEPGHPLWHAGCEWLCRDPESDDPGQAPAHAASAWRYGFHATLAAPMHLADGVTWQQLRQRLQTVVATRCAFPMPPLAVRPLGNFLALRPVPAVDAWHPLRRLADACVMACQALRRPLDAAEFERRALGLAGEADRDHLLRWGYPFVLDRWRFHMTLSDAGHGNDADLRRRAERHFAKALIEPMQCTSVALFTQAAPGAPLRLAERIA